MRFSGRLLIALALLALSACSSSGTLQTTPHPPEVRGLADFHSHQFAHLGFGGSLHSHDVDPTSGCRLPPAYNANSFHVENMVRDGLLHTATQQSKTARCYPTASNLAGQQMDTDSLKRAWEYGLRLLVVFAVNSEFLCHTAHFPPSFAAGGCYDFESIEAQLKAAYDLQTTIDDEAGGPGKGWYQIVLTPSDARRVIGEGKLAVVLGVESANAFGSCSIVSAGSEPGVPGFFPLIEGGGDETKRAMNCGDDTYVPGMAGPLALARLEHYRSLGARHFFPIHNIRGIAGGNSLSNPMLHAMANPSRLAPGGAFNRVADINRVISAIRIPFSRLDCSSSGYEFDSGSCGAVGLTSVGIALVKLMADYGSIIDYDHLSLLAKRILHNANVLGDHYPVISSHSGVREINHGDKSNEDQLGPGVVENLAKWNGAFAPILHGASSVSEMDTYPSTATVALHTCGGTTESFVQPYRYIVEKLSATKTWTGEPAYVGVGYGSDFNGLAGWPQGRFNNASIVIGAFDLQPAFIGNGLTVTGGRCFDWFGPIPPPNSPPHVSYPFISPMTGKSFDKSVLPWSGRTDPYDISFDGVAHVGMIPDFVEELRVLGLSSAELEPLWRGAESYIRTWEASLGWSGAYSNEHNLGIRAQCQNDRAALLKFEATIPESWASWNAAIQRLRAAGCDGTP